MRKFTLGAFAILGFGILFAGPLSANVEILDPQERLEADRLSALAWSESITPADELWVLGVLRRNYYGSSTLLNLGVEVVLEHDIKEALPILSGQARIIPEDPVTRRMIKNGYRGPSRACRQLAVALLQSDRPFDRSVRSELEARRVGARSDDFFVTLLRGIIVRRETKKVRRGEVADLSGIELRAFESRRLRYSALPTSNVMNELVPKIALATASQEGLKEPSRALAVLNTYGRDGADAILKYLEAPAIRASVTPVGEVFLLRLLKASLGVMTPRQMDSTEELVSVLEATRTRRFDKVEPMLGKAAMGEYAQIRAGIEYWTEGNKK